MAIGKVVWAAVAAALLAAASPGCRQPTYRILTDLPDPPASLGPQEDDVATPSPGQPPTQPSAGLTVLAPVAPAIAPTDPDLPPWEPDVRDVPWRYIVIHHSATETGSAATFDHMHRAVNHWDELGYHFVICNGNGNIDGAIEVGPRWYKQKWGAHTGHTPNNEYNEYGIGICLVGDFRQKMPSERQLASMRRLVTYLARRYEIPANRIVGHRDAPGAATECPGGRLHAYVLGALRKEVHP